MAHTRATELLRPGLLEGVRIVVAQASAPDAVEQAGHGEEAAAMAVRGACEALGAKSCACVIAAADAQETAVEEAVERALEQMGGADLLFLDGAALFARACEQREPRDALAACLEGAWIITRAVANRAFIEAGGGGRIVYLAPRRSAGTHADAAGAGLENLARTLSIEWARHGITPVAIAPGAATTSGEVAALTAYLASPAGAYFSGCLMDLGRGGR